MEYRPRRNGKSRRKRFHGRAYAGGAARESAARGEGAFGTFVLLLLLAALVYVFVATPVGAFVLSFFKAKGAGNEAPLPTRVPDTAPPPSGQTALTETVKLPGLELYALEMGRYDSIEDARSLINSLRSLGAAGYGLASGEGYRILASGYGTEAAAVSVKDRLFSQGYDCTLYKLEADEVDIDVTADETRLGAVRAAAALARSLIDELSEQVLRFDTEERGTEYGRAIVGELLERIREVRSRLSPLSDPGGAVKLLDGYFMELAACASELGSLSVDRVTFSGRLKSMQLEAADRYIRLLAALSSLASP